MESAFCWYVKTVRWSVLNWLRLVLPWEQVDFLRGGGRSLSKRFSGYWNRELDGQAR